MHLVQFCFWQASKHNFSGILQNQPRWVQRFINGSEARPSATSRHWTVGIATRTESRRCSHRYCTRWKLPRLSEVIGVSRSAARDAFHMFMNAVVNIQQNLYILSILFKNLQHPFVHQLWWFLPWAQFVFGSWTVDFISPSFLSYDDRFQTLSRDCIYFCTTRSIWTILSISVFSISPSFSLSSAVPVRAIVTNNSQTGVERI